MLDAHYKGKINISDYWAIGDSRIESISEINSSVVSETQLAQDIELAIIGMNHDDLTTPVNNISKAAITVQTLKCLQQPGYMNSSYLGANKDLWSKSQRRTWCNNEFVEALSNLKELVKPVVKLSNRYSTYSASKIQQETTEDYAFLLSQWEIWGEQKVDSDYGILPAEGFQYEYMKTNSNRIKSFNDSTSYWWARSSLDVGATSAHFVFVTTGGSYGYNGFASDSYGLAPAFCL